MKLPSVFAYLDYRTFLADWVDARKRHDPAYSYAVFAADGECSKGSLANVIRGARTPRPETLDAFARAMSLSPSERNYLGVLVDLAAARDAGHRLAVMERLLANEHYGQLRHAEYEPEESVDRYLSRWWIPAIREMVGMPGFRDDPAWIARTIHPPITVEQAAEAVQILTELEFVARDAQGSLVPRDIRFATDPEAQQSAVARFYREQLPELLRGLDVDRPQEQHLMAATLGFDEGTVSEAKARLHEMVMQLATVADARPADAPARVYQVVVMMAPISGVVGDPQEQASDD